MRGLVLAVAVFSILSISYGQKGEPRLTSVDGLFPPLMELQTSSQLAGQYFYRVRQALTKSPVVNIAALQKDAQYFRKAIAALVEKEMTAAGLKAPEDAPFRKWARDVDQALGQLDTRVDLPSLEAIEKQLLDEVAIPLKTVDRAEVVLLEAVLVAGNIAQRASTLKVVEAGPENLQKQFRVPAEEVLERLIAVEKSPLLAGYRKELPGRIEAVRQITLSLQNKKSIASQSLVEIFTKIEDLHRFEPLLSPFTFRVASDLFRSDLFRIFRTVAGDIGKAEALAKLTKQPLEEFIAEIGNLKYKMHLNKKPREIEFLQVPNVLKLRLSTSLESGESLLKVAKLGKEDRDTLEAAVNSLKDAREALDKPATMPSWADRLEKLEKVRVLYAQ